MGLSDLVFLLISSNSGDDDVLWVWAFEMVVVVIFVGMVVAWFMRERDVIRWREEREDKTEWKRRREREKKIKKKNNSTWKTKQLMCSVFSNAILKIIFYILK